MLGEYLPDHIERPVSGIITVHGLVELSEEDRILVGAGVMINMFHRIQTHTVYPGIYPLSAYAHHLLKRRGLLRTFRRTVVEVSEPAGPHVGMVVESTGHEQIMDCVVVT